MKIPHLKMQTGASCEMVGLWDCSKSLHEVSIDGWMDKEDMTHLHAHTHTHTHTHIYIYTQWNTTQPLKRMKFCHGWIWRFLGVFLGPHLWHMEVPRLGMESELQLPADTTATTMPDPNHVCDRHCSLRQH